MERINGPELDRYSIIREERNSVGVIEGEPDVRVAMPWSNLEDPSYRVGKVEVGGIQCPIDIHDFGIRTLEQPVEDRNGQMVTDVHTCAMVDPFSLRLQPRAAPPPSLGPADAARAVRHMKNAYLRFVNDKSKATTRRHHNRTDIVVL